MERIDKRVLHSVDETRSFGIEMAQRIQLGTVIALIGELGTGKTTFAQGFAGGLGIKDQVGSPTFKLVSEYHGDKLALYHVDCYRLKTEMDFLNIDGESLLYPEDGVTLIEWADVIQALLPDNTIILHFSRIPGKPDLREIAITGWSN